MIKSASNACAGIHHTDEVRTDLYKSRLCRNLSCMLSGIVEEDQQRPDMNDSICRDTTRSNV